MDSFLQILRNLLRIPEAGLQGLPVRNHGTIGCENLAGDKSSTKCYS